MGLENLSFGNKNTNPLDVLLKLFESKDISMKTKLTAEQFKSVMKTKYLREWQDSKNKDKSGLEIWMDICVPYGLELLVSIDGMSREQAERILSSIGGFLLQNEQQKLNEGTKI